MEDAMHVLQQAEDMVKLRIQKDEDNIGSKIIEIFVFDRIYIKNRRSQRVNKLQIQFLSLSHSWPHMSLSCLQFL